MSKRSLDQAILTRICEIEAELKELRKVRREVAATGTSSASISAGGGSKSYTRQSLGELTTLINELSSELKALRMRLSGTPIRKIQFIRY